MKYQRVICAGTWLQGARAGLSLQHGQVRAEVPPQFLFSQVPAPTAMKRGLVPRHAAWGLNCID